jgi:hypothetical protein
MRLRLAYLFLFIFSFQVLPIKEVGKLLFKSQMTEEIHETAPSSPDENQKNKKHADPYTGSNSAATLRLLWINHDAALAFQYADDVPAAHVPDIFTPPPNC